MISNENFQRVGGMCNSFFGWGKEDKYLRISHERKGVKIEDLKEEATGSNCSNTFRHIHSKKRLRDKKNCKAAKPVKMRCIGKIGPNLLKYDIDSIEEKKIGIASVTFLNVKVACNVTETPWCNAECV